MQRNAEELNGLSPVVTPTHIEAGLERSIPDVPHYKSIWLVLGTAEFCTGTGRSNSDTRFVKGMLC